MKRIICGVVLVALLSGCAATPRTWQESWQKFNRDTERSNAWPEPFLHLDRDAQKVPLRTMIENGWRVEHTMTETLFGSDERLTRAGEKRVKWIVTQSPEQWRTVYVVRGGSLEATEARLDSVQQYVAQLVPKGPMPAVVVTTKVPPGGSGEYLNEVHRMYRDSLPAPQLPGTTEIVN
jgi:hypothetical protein